MEADVGVLYQGLHVCVRARVVCVNARLCVRACVRMCLCVCVCGCACVSARRPYELIRV